MKKMFVFAAMFAAVAMVACCGQQKNGEEKACCGEQTECCEQGECAGECEKPEGECCGGCCEAETPAPAPEEAPSTQPEE